MQRKSKVRQVKMDTKEHWENPSKDERSSRSRKVVLSDEGCNGERSGEFFRQDE